MLEKGDSEKVLILLPLFVHHSTIIIGPTWVAFIPNENNIVINLFCPSPDIFLLTLIFPGKYLQNTCGKL